MGKELLSRSTTAGKDPELEDSKDPEKVRLYWLKQFYQEIGPSNNKIIEIDNAKYEQSDIKYFESELAKIIAVSAEEYKGEELRDVIGYVKDGLIDSIRSYKSAATKEGLEIYQELITTFLSKLKQWDATYTRGSALKETHSLGGGWSEIRWVQDDLWEVSDMSLSVGYTPIMQVLLGLPRRLSLLAIERNDYFIFNEFIRWYPYYYLRSFVIGSDNVRKSVVQLSSLHLSVMLRYYVIAGLESSDTEAKVRSYTDFALGIIFVFNQLLKVAMDEKHSDNFMGFLATLRDSFVWYFRKHQDYEISRLEFLVNNAASETERHEATQQLNLERLHVSAATELQNTMSVMLFGLNAWSLHKYLDAGVSQYATDEWKSAFTIATTLEESCKIYQLASATHSDEFGWMNWEAEEHERGPAYSGVISWTGGMNIYLRTFFCTNCLKILARLTEEQRRKTTLEFSSAGVFSIEHEVNTISGLLKQMKLDVAKWSPIIGDKGFEAIPAFDDLLHNALIAHKKRTDDFVRSAAISPDRLALLRREIVDGWRQNATLRTIVQEYGTYDLPNKPSKEKTRFGFNQLQPKDMYVDGTEMGIEGWGAQFGRDIGNWENSYFLKEVLDNIGELAIDSAGMSPITHLTDALDELKKKKYKPIILILNSWTTYYAIEKSGLLVHESNKTVKGFVGNFKYKSTNTPVFNLNYEGEPYLIVIDLKKFCVWRQFSPVLLGGEELLNRELAFSLETFTDQSAKEAITNNPKLLLGKNNNKMAEADAIYKLQLKVHFQLYEQYEIRIDDKLSGYRIESKY